MGSANGSSPEAGLTFTATTGSWAFLSIRISKESAWISFNVTLSRAVCNCWWGDELM
jgi:hypothetical protein